MRGAIRIFLLPEFLGQSETDETKFNQLKLKISRRKQHSLLDTYFLDPEKLLQPNAFYQSSGIRVSLRLSLRLS